MWPFTERSVVQQSATYRLAGVSLLRFNADGLVVDERDFYNEV